MARDRVITEPVVFGKRTIALGGVSVANRRQVAEFSVSLQKHRLEAGGKLTPAGFWPFTFNSTF